MLENNKNFINRNRLLSHSMDLLKQLETAGLTESEAKIYAALLQIGPINAGAIIKKTGLQSSTVYHCLDSLIDKGIVSFIVKNNRKYFETEKVDVLIDFIRVQEENLRETEKTLAENIQKIISQSKSGGKIEIKVFEGWRGLWTAFSDSLDALEPKQEIYVFTLSNYAGADPNLAKGIRNKIKEKRLKKKLYEKIIINEAEKETLGKDHEKVKNTEVRYLPQNLSHPAIVHVYGERVLIAISSEKPMGILIKDKITAESFKNYFFVLWEIAKPALKSK